MGRVVQVATWLIPIRSGGNRATAATIHAAHMIPPASLRLSARSASSRNCAAVSAIRPGRVTNLNTWNGCCGDIEGGVALPAL